MATSVTLGHRPSRLPPCRPVLLVLLCLLGCPSPPGGLPAGTPSAAAPAAQSSPAASPRPDVPRGRLPGGVRPLRYRLSLEIVPERPEFSGQVEIDVALERATERIWLHGDGLQARAASVTPRGAVGLPARYEQFDSGVVALVPASPVPPGQASVRIEFSGRFDPRLEGLYRAESGGRAYAFTQFEPLSARKAFPCFDEPAYKTPFEVTLVVPAQGQAVANTRELGRAADREGLVRVRFVPTEPLPTYLVAFAVGPLDIVPGAPVPPSAVRPWPLPLRGVAVRGRGPELGYALAHTGPILAALEDYFGIAYPYDKLDIIAVPDKSGAMENPGAMTFREWLLLFDERTAPLAQKRAFAFVVAHELAHAWFGDLVTMPWWDDIWLNEAFATWMGNRAVASWRPEYEGEVALLRAVHSAMEADSLASARQIRQPIGSHDDILNAFDAITYRKGGGVLGMFERWLGPELFRQAVRTYLGRHRFGSATEADFLAALSETSGRDVATPFRSFLLQSGLPHVDVRLVCEGGQASLLLEQSRFLPVGSRGDPRRLWQIPVCVRYAAGAERRESCTLLAEQQGRLPLQGGACPRWVLPNADGAGYYRWSLPARELRQILGDGLVELPVRERMSLADSLAGSFARATLPAAEVLGAMAPLAADPHPAVAAAPMGLLRAVRLWLDGDPLQARVEAFGRVLLGPVQARLGWDAAPGEPPERELLRVEVTSFLALSARDPALRQEAARRGRAYVGFGTDGRIHPEAVDPDLASVALAVAGEQADAALYDALLGLLPTVQDDEVRARLVTALGAALDPELSRRALALPLDPRLRVNEALSPLWAQLGRPETRAGAWAWIQAHLDELAARLPLWTVAGLPWLASYFCDEQHAAEAELLFGSRARSMPGAAHNLDGAVEEVRLCAASKAAQLASAREFFESRKR
ncbi:MAG: M1 family metallopeptidase [Deltaproteobacteria bacterium]|nr:M1 family metallopeptidase [Deltaproteobacteria bacterium]